MSEAGEKTQKDRDNLARIRENQRRSRARRKEYLSEIEDRLRQCEQSGVSATAEVQAAAKLVLAENKRLRALLLQKGVSDAEIEAFDLNGVSNGGTYDSIPPSMTLEALIKHRYPCGSTAPNDSSLAGDVQTANPRTQCAPRLGLQPASVGISHSNDVYGPPLIQGGPQSAQPVWPGTADTAAVADFSHNPSMVTVQHPAVYPTQSEGHEDWARDFTMPAADLTAASSCSCAEAADMIRAMGVDPDDAALKSELGCDAGDVQCRASNELLFSVLDRYG